MNKYSTNSPLNVSEYYRTCKKVLNYEDDLCFTFFGIMFAESHFCTDFYAKDYEDKYHNCTGIKSKEIMSKHQSDSNGSWLKAYNSYDEYYREGLKMFHDYYWTNGGSQLRTPEKISRKWVGRYSEGWVAAVKQITNQL
jgi:hypothetical protein